MFVFAAVTVVVVAVAVVVVAVAVVVVVAVAVCCRLLLFLEGLGGLLTGPWLVSRGVAPERHPPGSGYLVKARVSLGTRCRAARV